MNYSFLIVSALFRNWTLSVVSRCWRLSVVRAFIVALLVTASLCVSAQGVGETVVGETEVGETVVGETVVGETVVGDGGHVAIIASKADYAGHARKLTFKTNFVGAAMAIANLAVEYQFARNVSVDVPAYFSSWDFYSTGKKFRCFIMQPELRWYFDRRQHFALGLHAGFAYYNVSYNDDYRYQSHNKNCPMGGGGISVTYRTRFGKHWGLEICVGGGVYLNERDRYSLRPCTCSVGDYSSYENMRCTCRDAQYKRTCFMGVDKFGISLTYTLNFKKKTQ